MRENTNSTVSHKKSAHPHHAPYRHSRAHENPFIHTRRMSHLETYSPQQTTQSETDNHTGNEAVIPSYNTRCTMDPHVREDDELIDRKRPTDRSEKEKVRKQRMRENTNSTVSHKNSAPATPPVVIPVNTRIHSSTHARCHICKCTHHRQQHRAKLTTTLAMKRKYQTTTLAARWILASVRMTRKRIERKSRQTEVVKKKLE
ncbi:Ribosomal S7-like protein [Vibrio vulnificus]|nr:Ribosomal S7-like protein [Vibrio vulnificus]